MALQIKNGLKINIWNVFQVSRHPSIFCLFLLISLSYEAVWMELEHL